MNKNKLGISYNVFNGEELLEASIRNMRECVDYINIVWQDVSWTGEKANPKLIHLLEKLKTEQLVDNVIKYNFVNIKNPRKMSCEKKNIGIKDMRECGCTYFMLMDSDEFYNKDEFCKARDFIYENRITHSVCGIYDYRVLPIYRMRDVRDYTVGFIFKMTPFSSVIGIRNINRFPCIIDELRIVPMIPFVSKFFYMSCINMHHMTGVRRDYDNKMRNTITNHFENGKQAIARYSNMQKQLEDMSEDEILKNGYIIVEDNFNIMPMVEKWSLNND